MLDSFSKVQLPVACRPQIANQSFADLQSAFFSVAFLSFSAILYVAVCLQRQIICKGVKSYESQSMDCPVPVDGASVYGGVALAATNTNMATIVLQNRKDWKDGSGYQMLLDATATTYGVIIPTSGPLSSEEDSTQEVYDQFRYKIPLDAGWTRNTDKFIAVDQDGSIEIPAGVYDYCIVNPTPEDSMWIANDDTGPATGRANNFRFRAGYTYTFTVSNYNGNDGVVLTITGEGVPETGDAANTMLWVLLMLTAAAAVCVLCRKKAIRERE